MGSCSSISISTTKGRMRPRGHDVVPKNSPVEKLKRMWLRLWPRNQAPKLVAQHARHVDRRQLERVLKHHLGRFRNGQPIRGIPRLEDRVITGGEIQACFTSARARLKNLTVSELKDLASDDRDDLLKSVRRRSVRPGCCCWCRRKRSKGATKWCSPSCRSAASRALQSLARRFGTHVFEWIHEREEKGWTRQDAIREVVYELGTSMPRRASLEGFRCPECGGPIASRPKAKTCGRPTCRSRRSRRLRDATKSACQGRRRSVRDAETKARSSGTSDLADSSVGSPSRSHEPSPWRLQHSQLRASRPNDPKSSR
jgi:hypothetical protein